MIQLWDAASGQPLGQLEGHTKSVPSIAFADGGKKLVSCSRDRTARLWDVDSRRQLSIFRGKHFLYAVAVTADGKALATSSEDKTIALWDIASGKQIGNFIGSGGTVLMLDFSPDGKTLLSGGIDDKAVLWDVSKGEAIRTYPYTDSVRSVAFSPDGALMAMGTDGGVVKLIDASSGREAVSISAGAAARQAEKSDATEASHEIPVTAITPVHFTPTQLKEYYSVYGLPDVAYLRTVFNAYLAGKPAVGRERAEEYKVLKAPRREFNDSFLKSKFIVLSRTVAVFGGTYVKLLFQDHSDKIYSAWVYAVDKNPKHRVFALRALDEDKSTDEEIRAIKSRYRQFIQDKVHAM